MVSGGRKSGDAEILQDDAFGGVDTQVEGVAHQVAGIVSSSFLTARRSGLRVAD